MELDGISGSDDFEVKGINSSGSVALDELSNDEQSRIKRTSEAADSAIDALANLPIEGVPITTATVNPPKNSSNIFFKALRVGLKVEERYRVELNRYSQEALNIQAHLEKLINLSGKLSLSDINQKEFELTEEVKTLSLELKNLGMDLLQGTETKLSREKVGELKTTITAHIDRLKMNLQTLFTTKIQVDVNELNAMLECLKTIEKYMNRLFSSIIANQKGR